MKQEFYVIETVRNDDPNAEPNYVCSQEEEGMEPSVLVYNSLEELYIDLILSPIPEKELNEYTITPKKLILTISDMIEILDSKIEPISEEELQAIDIEELTKRCADLKISEEL